MLCSLLIAASLTVTNAFSLIDATRRGDTNVAFGIEGNITAAAGYRYIMLEDSTGALEMFQGYAITNLPAPVRGDRVRVTGITIHHKDGSTIPIVYGYKHLSHTEPEQPCKASIADLKQGRFDNKLITTRGTVKDIFQDEIDPEWHYLVLENDKSAIYAAIHSSTAIENLQRLTDAEISLVGICIRRSCGSRQLLDRVVAVLDPSDITTIKPAPQDPYLVPPLEDLQGLDPEEIIATGRRSCIGHVLCLYGRNILLEDTNRLSHVVTFASEDPTLPRPGMFIKTAGIPTTDLYRINLTSAIWQRLPDRPRSETTPLSVSADDILYDKAGRRMIKPSYHGRTVRLTGTVQDLFDVRSDVITIKSGDVLVPVDLSANRGLIADIPASCEMEVTGICIIETASWHSYARFPHATGLLLVPRSPKDIKVLKNPPWWTPARLMTLIGALLAGILGILCWNLTLHHVTTRKGRELFKEQLGHVKADLRTEERTRLAVELHDSLAQNLTGVSMEIEAANVLRGQAPQPMLDHLRIAAKALKSCRDELRNCLWDLRSQALEEPDMSKAVLRTLQPHVNDSRLSVRFNVKRSRLSDKTAHALLRVIRELVVNAIRHGEASVIRIAGATEDGRLLCSVRDNGCGFDPEKAPGVLQGHFGLQGIRERIEEIGGEFTLDSNSRKGTRATISIPIPCESET